MRFRKIYTAVFLSMLLAVFSACPALAGDTYSTISSVKITVSDSLKNLKAGEPWPSISSSDFDVNDTEKYEITNVEWYDSNMGETMRAGETARVVVSLSAGSKTKSNGDEIIYRFSGSYGASNVRISNGTFESAKRNGYYDLEVSFTLKPAQGDYDEAENLTWSPNNLGYASWTAPDNGSGYYDVALYRDNKKVVTIRANSLTLNLYPWMDKEGEYHFTVVTVPYTEEQSKYASKSDAASSENVTITDANKSNGEGQYSTTQISSVSVGNAGSTAGSSTGGTTGNSGTTSGSTAVGWYQSGGNWYFRYPNQQPAVSSWLSWQGKWYHFNSQGQMETGWFQSPYGKWYYLDPTNGYAKTGWQQIAGSWYYLNPAVGDTEGAMYQSTLTQIGSDTYYFDEKGHMQTGWKGIKDAAGQEQYYYFYADGRMARSTQVDGFVLDANGRWVH